MKLLKRVVPALMLTIAALTGFSCKSVDPENKVEKISVKGAGAAFTLNSKFQKSVFTVTATMTDSTTVPVESDKCSFVCNGETYTDSTVLNKSGDFTVKVTYEGKSADCKFSVSDSVYPSYSDNYSSISGWNNKAKWNLANTHDPTVFYWDGYYYMFGTDASYGNAHNSAPSGKHFQGKRSKDLVNWEWVPGPFDACPSWVNTKLNKIRSDMGLSSIDMTTAANAAIIGYWAPCARVIEVNGVKKIRMYYSIVADYMIGNGKPNDGSNFDNTWSERAFIGVCETTNPNGGPSAWTDLGFVTCSSSDKELNYSRSSTSDWNGYFYFNAIDPTYFIDDDGSHWMVYGSWHSGIAITRINPATGKIAAVTGSDYLTGDVTGDFEVGNPWADSAEGLKKNGYGTRIYSRFANSRWQGSEGPELVKYNGKYYLFLANDGLDIPYHTRVVRADKVTGPYLDFSSRDFTDGSTGNPLPVITHPYKFGGDTYGWVGFGHCAVFQNEDGDWFYMSQARLPADVAGINVSNALMMGHVRRIFWVPAGSSGSGYWPVVSPERYAGLSSLPANMLSADDIAGEWEFIDLYYQKSVMREASTVTFTKTSDNGGTTSGAISKSWSFNPSTNILTVGSQQLKVERECDWEASPRTGTLVFAGISDSKNSWWGKKKDYNLITSDPDEDEPESSVLPVTVSGTIEKNKKVDAIGSSYINSATGVSLSMKLDATYDSDWTQIFNVESESNGTYYVGLSLINHWKDDAQVDTLFESKSTIPWDAYINTACYVTISFNTDGTISYYKNGVKLGTYASDAETVKDNVKVSTAGDYSEKIIEAIADKGFSVNVDKISDLIIDVAVDDTQALNIYNTNK